ncbi:hypothetical protein TI39_contig3978g00001, partial [Zymoseptoria brevis]
RYIDYYIEPSNNLADRFKIVYYRDPFYESYGNVVEEVKTVSKLFGNNIG